MALRETQNLGVADDGVKAETLRGQLLDNIVGEAVGETEKIGIAGLVVKAQDGNDGNLL
jgi:hypothetical protein